MQNFYDVLGLKPEASDDTIKAAFRKLAMQHHPDRNPGNEEAEIKYKEVSAAFDVLSDPQQKLIYDARLQKHLKDIKQALTVGYFIDHRQEALSTIGSFFKRSIDYARVQVDMGDGRKLRSRIMLYPKKQQRIEPWRLEEFSNAVRSFNVDHFEVGIEKIINASHPEKVLREMRVRTLTEMVKDTKGEEDNLARLEQASNELDAKRSLESDTEDRVIRFSLKNAKGAVSTNVAGTSVDLIEYINRHLNGYFLKQPQNDVLLLEAQGTTQTLPVTPPQALPDESSTHVLLKCCLLSGLSLGNSRLPFEQTEINEEFAERLKNSLQWRLIEQKDNNIKYPAVKLPYGGKELPSFPGFKQDKLDGFYRLLINYVSGHAPRAGNLVYTDVETGLEDEKSDWVAIRDKQVFESLKKAGAIPDEIAAGANFGHVADAGPERKKNRRSR